MLEMPHLDALNWDFSDQLKSTEKTDETTHYVYSGGERVRKVVMDTSGTPRIKYERIYLGGYELYREYDVSENLDLERATHKAMDDKRLIALLEVKTVESGTPISSSSQITITRYQYTNHLDSASLELDENAAVVSYEEYHPFGTTSYSMHTNDADVSLKRYKYVHKELDTESGLYYYGARYYAGWLCRFTSVDPRKDQYAFQNSYAYAANSPVTLTDINGEGPGSGEPVVADKDKTIYTTDSDGNRTAVGTIEKGATYSLSEDKKSVTINGVDYTIQDGALVEYADPSGTSESTRYDWAESYEKYVKDRGWEKHSREQVEWLARFQLEAWLNAEGLPTDLSYGAAFNYWYMGTDYAKMDTMREFGIMYTAYAALKDPVETYVQATAVIGLATIPVSLTSFALQLRNIRAQQSLLQRQQQLSAEYVKLKLNSQKTYIEPVKLNTSSKSEAPSRTYTIYDGSGKLYKFGVTDAKLKRYNISLKEAGPDSYGRYSSIMPKYQAHISEKYLRSLHYNSTGQYSLPGMKIPYPRDLNSGKILKP